MGKTKTEEPVEELNPERPDTVGVPQEPASQPEPQGPEDALGPGTTRGDYRDRMGDSTSHYEGGVHQNPRTDDIGDTEGRKGGVETPPSDDEG